MLNYQIIHGPTQNTIELLKNKMNPKNRERVDKTHYGAVAIFQTNIPSLYYYADIGQKAGEVITLEILGNCPQSLGSMAFFGDIAAVKAAMQAVISQEEASKPGK